MSWDNNPYYHPEATGLEIVAQANISPPYSFDMFVVWKDDDGNFYYGEDSGCSCPSPFEATEPTKVDTWQELQALVEAWNPYDGFSYWDDDYEHLNEPKATKSLLAARHDILMKAKEAGLA